MKHVLFSWIILRFFVAITAHADATFAPDIVVELELNDGKAWQVHAHMHARLTNMAATIKAAPEIVTPEQAASLVDDLEVDIYPLLSGCTMTGAAHDALHIFLMTLFPQVESMKEHTEVSDRMQTHANLSELFRLYGIYFTKAPSQED